MDDESGGRHAGVSMEQVEEDNRKCQYWKKGWRGAIEGRERAWKMCLFSWLERFNQVHIGVVNHKGPPLVCGSRRGAGEQAEASLFRPLPLKRRKEKKEPKQNTWQHTLPPSCNVLSIDLYSLFSVSHSPRSVSTGPSLLQQFTSAFQHFNSLTQFAPHDKDLILQ